MSTLLNDFTFIDFSQYNTWFKCPWAWYERYVAQRVRPFDPTRQRDDAICVGSLVHAGLESWYKDRTTHIPEEVIQENNPTPETMTLVKELLLGYIQHYPVVPWKVERLEAPLTKHLWDNNYLLAKVDQYFQVVGPEPLMIESGIPGEHLTLLPGYYIQENKTKAIGVDRAKFFRRWTVNMQADFQLIALREHLRSQGITAPVHGVLVNVLEKPKEYIPERTCKNKECAAKIPLAAYLPAPPGEYTFVSGGKKPKNTVVDASKCGACPLCGNIQELKAYTSEVERKPTYYRLVTTRTEEELEISELQIQRVLDEMNNMRYNGRDVISPNKSSCVDTIFGDCEYYKNHKYNIPVEEDEELETKDATKYVELFKILEAA